MELIDRAALIDFIDCGHLRNPLESCFSERDVVDMLEARPEVDAVPVVHGRWIDTGADYWERGRTSTRYKCSNCGRKAGEKQARVYFYCPHCGAKMDAECVRDATKTSGKEQA